MGFSTSVNAQAVKPNTTNNQLPVAKNQADDILRNQLDQWLKENLDADAYKELQGLHEKISEIAQMLDSQTKTEIQIASLEREILKNESLVREKKKTLADIQQKIDLLKLSTNQIATIERYNRTLDRDPHFTEWITERGTWFEILKDVGISAAFLFIGIWIESIRQRRKKKKTARTAKNTAA